PSCTPATWSRRPTRASSSRRVQGRPQRLTMPEPPGALAQTPGIRSARVFITPGPAARAAPGGRRGPGSASLPAPGPAPLQLEQPDRGQLVGDENVQEPAVQRAENGPGLVQPA